MTDLLDLKLSALSMTAEACEGTDKTNGGFVQYRYRCQTKANDVFMDVNIRFDATYALHAHGFSYNFVQEHPMNLKKHQQR